MQYPPARPGRASPRRRGRRALLVAVLAAAALAFGLYSLTGVYVMAPRDAPPAGATIWYYRRGSGLPFLSSPDSRRLARQAARSPELVAIAPRQKWVIARFAFNRAVYLRATGGVEPVK
jgi:hypothetical protein